MLKTPSKKYVAHIGRTVIVVVAFCAGCFAMVLIVENLIRPAYNEMMSPDGVDELNELDEEGRTPLYVAVERGDRKSVETLLARGADVEARTHAGISPLYCAAFNGNIDIMKLLIEHGAEVNAQIVEGLTALFAASEKDHTQAIDFLVKQGADVNAKAVLRPTETPLHEAAFAGSLHAAKHLIKHGADVNARNSKAGMSPLHIAAIAKHEKMMALLIENGADASLQDVYGQTAEELMKLMSQRETRRLETAANRLPTLQTKGIVSIVYTAMVQNGRRYDPSPAVGFVVGDGRWVITAAHCVERFVEESRKGDLAKPLILSACKGDLVEAEIVAINSEADVALLRPQWAGHSALQLASESGLSKGMEVFVAGYPPPDCRADTGQVAGVVCVEALPVLQIDPQGGRRAITLGGARYIGPGWSGSPILHAATGAVLGVFGNRDHVKLGDTVLINHKFGCDVEAIRTLFHEQEIEEALETALPAEPGGDAERAYAAALDYFDGLLDEDPGKALAAVTEWAQLRPCSVWVNLLAAWTVIEAQSKQPSASETLPQAETLFLAALRQGPDSAAAHAAFAQRLLHEGRYEEARQQFEQALDIEPDMPFAVVNLLAVLTELDPLNAVKRGQVCVEQMPDVAAAWFAYAGALRKLERFEDAVEAARSAVHLAREDEHWFYGRLADILAKSGRIDEAEACYKVMLEQKPDVPHYQKWYAEFLTQYRNVRIVR